MQTPKDRFRTLFFAVLVALNTAHLLVGFASIPRYYERVTGLSIPVLGLPGENNPTNESVAHSAATHHLTLSGYAVTQIVYHSAVVLLCMAIALLIIWRARWNWFAWYSAFLLVFLAGFAFYDQIVVALLLPPWVFELGALLWPLVLLYFFLFPNGKAVPRRALWLLVPILVLHFAFQATGFLLVLAADASLNRMLNPLVAPLENVIGVAFLFILGCQVYRYLGVSNLSEKQQTKWFLFGFAFFITLSIVSDSLGELNPFAEEIGLLIFVFVPVSIGIAILRYRLWDIDILIRRTVTYALVVGLLLVVYFGSVIVLQQIFVNLTGVKGSEIVTVLSTLAIAALFVPLRNRIRNEIDKRFNRKKYDAQQVLSDFANTVRDETDLEKLTGRLVQVVDETMQPKSVSVWLKPSREQRKTAQERGRTQ